MRVKSGIPRLTQAKGAVEEAHRVTRRRRGIDNMAVAYLAPIGARLHLSPRFATPGWQGNEAAEAT